MSVLRTVVADRDPDQRELLRRALGRDPAIVVVAEASDGPGAVDAVVAEAADVLVLDADLPRLDGPAVVDALRRAGSTCRCVFVTSVAPGELRAAGPVGVVARSTPVLHLAAAVRAVAAAVEAVDDAREAASTFDADHQAPRAARRFVDDVLAAAGYDDVLDTVELLVTELVTNAVTHARSEATVVIRLLPDAVRVEVTDLDDSFPVRRVPHADRPGGRGIELVERMSRAWGIDMLPVGKRTWFEVAREAAVA